MFKNLKRKFAKLALTVMALQIAVMGLGTGATGVYAAVPVDFDGVVTEFVLYDATTNLPIVELTAGVKINMAAVGTNLNIVANTLPGTVGSVSFVLSGEESYTRTESAAPYALKGDSPTGMYLDWTPSVGNYYLEATPWSQSGATGVPGVPLAISFSVYNDDVAPSVTTVVSGSYLLNEEVVVNYSPLDVVVEFDEDMDTDVEPVLAFTTDISSSVACVGGWLDLDEYKYTCTLIDSDVELTGVTGTLTGAKDLAGNLQNEFAPFASLDIDTKAPVVKLFAITPTNKTVIPASITFSEAVIGFDLSKITIANGTATNLTGGPLEYKFDIIPVDVNSSSDIKVELFAGAVTDLAGNENIATNQLAVSFDGEAPKAVTGLTTFVDTAGHVTVSWTNPPADTYSTLRIVRVGDFTITLTPTATSYTDLTTERGKSYEYVVIVGDEAGNETKTLPVTVSVPAPVVAAVVSDSTDYTALDTNTNTDTNVEEVKAETDTEEAIDSTNDDENGFPAWGLVLLLILAAVGGYLIWNGKPAPVVAPVKNKNKK